MISKIISTFSSAIQSRIIPITTRISLWTNKNYIVAKLQGFLRVFLNRKISVKPRNKDDYYPFFRWLVSKRLVHRGIILIGILCLFYITFVNPIFKSLKLNTPTYYYNSFILKFVSGEVNIKAASGYVAYTGDVDSGYCNGDGELYGKNGKLVYEGDFVDNKYEGTGKLYYTDGALKYKGDFVENVFEGSGTLYRENGSTEYVGDFIDGMKDGNGVLYDTGDKLVFTGSFQTDYILYQDFLGKTTSEASSMYTGSKIIYEDDDTFMVLMPEINAMYTAASDQDKLDDSMTLDATYVFDNEFNYNRTHYASIQALREDVSDLRYDGNTYIRCSEAVAVNRLIEMGNTDLEKVTMETENEFDDVITVTSYDEDYTLYLYSFSDGDIEYTFFCHDNSGKFDFYMLEAIE